MRILTFAVPLICASAFLFGCDSASETSEFDGTWMVENAGSFADVLVIDGEEFQYLEEVFVDDLGDETCWIRDRGRIQAREGSEGEYLWTLEDASTQILRIGVSGDRLTVFEDQVTSRYTRSDRSSFTPEC